MCEESNDSVFKEVLYKRMVMSELKYFTRMTLYDRVNNSFRLRLNGPLKNLKQLRSIRKRLSSTDFTFKISIRDI